MDEKLPSEYDSIVLGTGMTESIVAAALARVGHSVLHLDRNDYYSGNWASFHFEGLRDWIRTHTTEASIHEYNRTGVALDLLEAGESSLVLNIDSDTISNVEERIYVREGIEPVETENAEDTEDTEEAEISEEITSPHGQENESDQRPQHGDADSASQHSSGGDTSEARKTDEEEVVVENTERAEIGGTKTGEAKNSDSEKEKQWSFSEIKRQWRKFSIDLMPKLLYCRGSMVELLIESDIAKYCEFRAVSRIITQLNGKLQQVPCSRADVFSSKMVTMVEKRMMMKFLLFCLDFDKHPEEFEGFEERPFTEFLLSKKLSVNIRHYVQHALAMVTSEATTLEALKCTQTFLRSLGRYGNTAFLWPLYGSGELPQCFCRMCAVFGGIYCLRRTGQLVITDNTGRCKGVLDTEGQRLTCKNLIMDSSYASREMLKPPSGDRKQLSRSIVLTDRSLVPDSREHISMLRLPVTEGRPHPVTVLELAPSAMASPQGIYVVHLSCLQSSTSEEDLSPLINELFLTENDGDPSVDRLDTRPRVMWALYFNIALAQGEDLLEKHGSNMFVVAGPNDQLDFEDSIAEAKKIFSKICSDNEEFLPKAPNPEDIIYDDKDTKETALGDEDNDTSGTTEHVCTD